jgi:hypothetical protein
METCYICGKNHSHTVCVDEFTINLRKHLDYRSYLYVVSRIKQWSRGDINKYLTIGFIYKHLAFHNNDLANQFMKIANTPMDFMYLYDRDLDLGTYEYP